ncbi:MAG: hypothetical protein Q8922_10985 [Bacteroidota bacterium]|nr:hypothetical protein [Bacteroidota bacterium]MDP4233636.1 hypothetical protein [Bacteroidota bacterium]MDP4243104.1 hypothetical protein [Bacteroidota bacterium]MDP4288450.1 hypothetical protein [Bacteroidota bacterium]
MTVILNGPLGVGKTETAWKLLDYLDHAAILDCDYVGGNTTSIDHRDSSSVHAALECVAALAKYQSERMGIEHFVVSGVFETQVQLSLATSMLSEINRPVFPYLLLATPVELERRVRVRGNGNVLREVDRALELLKILGHNRPGKLFDVTNLTVDQTAETLWKDIQLLQSIN